MKKRKIYIGILIIIFILLLIIIIGIMLLKNKNINENISDKEEIKETYSGLMQCIKFSDNENYTFRDMEYLEIEENKVKSSEIIRAINFLNYEDYESFKQNENIINPVYDDEKYAVEYITKEKTTMQDENVQEYIKPLTEQGYECEKVINN